MRSRERQKLREKNGRPAVVRAAGLLEVGVRIADRTPGMGRKLNQS
jgi:hypothetical protein